MRKRMQEALKESRADYTDIRLEKNSSSGVNFKGKELDHIGSSVSTGGIVRALVKGGWGLSTFNDLGDLGARVREAVESAQMVGQEKTQLADVEPSVDTVSTTLEEDFREVPLEKKKSTIQAYNELIVKYDKRIETTNVNYGDSFRVVRFASSQGAYIEQELAGVSVSLSAVARSKDNVQVAHKSFADPLAGFRRAQGLEEEADGVAQRAVRLLDAPPVKGGTYTVVLDPILAGIFVHEAFGHLSEADHVYENEEMKKLMVLGKRFGPDHLNIIDDGSLPGLRGTRKYDDEGTRTRKNHLIKDGILVGRLHSRETAAKMKEQATGNARALNYRFEPIVRMTNTYIHKGKASFEDMIRDIKLGVYAVDWFGGQTAMEMFTFSAGYGYMIRDGHVAEMVRDVVLTGNVFDTLMRIDMIGDEVVWSRAGGGCGKGGQSPLPVDSGSPYIRIQGVVVGGRQ